MADIEGLKLDFLILQKQIEENTQQMPKSKTCTDLLDCKKIGVKRYYSLFPKKTMQSQSWTKNLLTFKSRVLTLEQENDLIP